MTRITRLVLTSVVLAGAILGAFASSALASTPETPELSVIEPTGSSALLHGVLNPNAVAEGQAGTYQFVYRASTTKQCKGAGEAVTPETPGLSMGLAQEETPYESISGLTADTEYAVCLVVTETGKTAPAVSAPVTFKTLTPPETPETDPATGVTGTGATFNATLNPHHPGEEGEKYKFFYRESATECQGEGEKQEPEFALPANGAEAEAVSVSPSNLLPDTTYTYCIWVRNEAFETAIGSPQTFETPVAAPTVTNEAVTNIRSNEVTVTAQIFPGAVSTTYQVEYEPGKFTPEQTLPASKTPVPVTQVISGLAPNTSYEARFLAHNEAGSGEGPIDFKTSSVSIGSGPESSGCSNSKLSGFSRTLPDCRAAELVSPASEIGETYDPGGSNGHEEDTTTARPYRSAAQGSAVAYIADPGPVGGDGSSAKGKGNEYLATRGPDAGPGGWEAVDITPPVGVDENASDEREYEFFSPDLSVGILLSETPLLAAQPTPQGPDGCNVLYARNASSGPSAYQALFTETTTPGNCGPADSRAEPARGADANLVFAGETADHSQKLFQTPAPLVAPTAEAEEFGGNLYDSVGGALSVVNKLPGGAVAPHATFGAPSGTHRNAPDFSHVISADGSRAFWTAVENVQGPEESGGPRPVALYARENPSSSLATTVQLDAAEVGAAGPSGNGQFWTASSDGNDVFFTDCNQLTTDSTANSSEGCQQAPGGQELRTGNDLYVYDFARPLGERLEDLTVDHNPGDPLGANVQGVIGASEDGSYVYFVAGGALESAPNSRDEAPTTQTCEAGGLCNLYEEHNNGSAWEEPRFIAALSATDDNLRKEKLNDPGSGNHENAGDWMPNLGSRTAEISPNGQHLVFESTEQLTEYNNADVASDNGGEGGIEVFVYDANANTLACASCNPTGASPTATIQANGAIGFSPYVPVSSSSTFMHRWMNSQGTEVFFNTSQPLVGGDSNGTQDVYEWEAEGGSSCPKATSQYGGCVFLLSGGESTDYSFLVDTDESGENVYLTHRGQLDGVGPAGEKAHLYDLRIGGGFAEPATGCTGVSTCGGTPIAPPTVVSPPSITFEGIGNFAPVPKPKPETAAQIRAKKLAAALKACKKAHAKSKKRRVACERSARRKYGSAAKKAAVKR